MSVLCVAVHPTLDILFTGGADGNLIFWQLSTGKQRRISNLGLENILDLSCTSLYLAASTKKNVAVVYEITLTMRDTHIIPKVRLTHKAAVNAVLVHPGNQFVVTASGDGEIKFWDVKGWACVRSMTGHSRGIACLALSHSGKHLISGSADNTCRIWDLASGGQIACLVSHSNLVRSVCVGRDANGNDIIISGSYDGFVMVWSQVKTPEGIDVWYVREKFDVREMLKWRNPAHVVEGRDNRVFRVCWDKVKKEVVVATQRGHVAAWNL
jgi:WD40 repeat protein